MDNQPPAVSAPQRTPWYRRTRWILLTLLLFPYVAALMVWRFKPEWPKPARLAIYAYGAIVGLIVLAGVLAPKSATPTAQTTPTPQSVAAAPTDRPTATVVPPTKEPTVAPTAIPLTAPENPDRIAFMDYGKQLWKIGADSDQAQNSMQQTFTQAATLNAGQLYTGVKNARDTQQVLLSRALQVKVPDRGKKARDGLSNMLAQRKIVGDQALTFLDTRKPSDQAAFQESAKTAQAATLSFAAEMVGLAAGFGVDLEELKQ